MPDPRLKKVANGNSNLEHLPSHIFAPLPKWWNIRVAKLKPGTPEHPIRIKLKVIDLRNTKYTALSYYSGSDNDDSRQSAHGSIDSAVAGAESTNTVLVDRTPVRITKQLWQALEQLRDLVSDVPIWVDQLCIDMRNREERGAQVNLVGKIYSTAASTLVWLGRKNITTDSTIITIRKLINAIDWRRLPANFQPDLQDPYLYQHFGIEQISVQQWKHVHHFCHLKWFSRVWGFFELAGAKSAVFLVGDTFLDYDKIRDFAMVMISTGWNESLSALIADEANETSIGLPKMLSMVSALRGKPVWSPKHTDHAQWMNAEHGLQTESERAWMFLELLLRQTQDFRSYDARDKIYAPLSYVRRIFEGVPLNKNWPSVDYNTPANDLYHHFIELIRKNTHQQSILAGPLHVSEPEAPDPPIHQSLNYDSGPIPQHQTPSPPPHGVEPYVEQSDQYHQPPQRPTSHEMYESHEEPMQEQPQPQHEPQHYPRQQPPHQQGRYYQQEQPQQLQQPLEQHRQLQHDAPTFHQSPPRARQHPSQRQEQYQPQSENQEAYGQEAGPDFEPEWPQPPQTNNYRQPAPPPFQAQHRQQSPYREPPQPGRSAPPPQTQQQFERQARGYRQPEQQQQQQPSPPPERPPQRPQQPAYPRPAYQQREYQQPSYRQPTYQSNDHNQNRDRDRDQLPYRSPPPSQQRGQDGRQQQQRQQQPSPANSGYRSPPPQRDWDRPPHRPPRSPPPQQQQQQQQYPPQQQQRQWPLLD